MDEQRGGTLSGAPDGWTVDAVFRTEDIAGTDLIRYTVHFTVCLPSGVRMPISGTFVQAPPYQPASRTR
jgi:hypothetical protein